MASLAQDCPEEWEAVFVAVCQRFLTLLLVMKEIFCRICINNNHKKKTYIELKESCASGSEIQYVKSYSDSITLKRIQAIFKLGNSFLRIKLILKLRSSFFSFKVHF